MAADFGPLYEDLRALMLRSAPGMDVTTDTDGELQMVARWRHRLKPNAPMWFGKVQRGKAYVSYHLMPLYLSQDLLAQVPEALNRRKRGKTCFAFKAADPALFADLARLTEACAAAFAAPI